MRHRLESMADAVRRIAIYTIDRPAYTPSPRLALTHNLGGSPGECVSFVSIVGNELSEEA